MNKTLTADAWISDWSNEAIINTSRNGLCASEITKIKEAGLDRTTVEGVIFTRADDILNQENQDAVAWDCEHRYADELPEADFYGESEEQP